MSPGTVDRGQLSAFSHNSLRSAWTQGSDIIYQIPDVLVRFDFSKSGHPAESDAIFHNPKQFTIGICLHLTRGKVRRAWVHPSAIVSRAAAVGAMTHGTISGVELVSFLDARLQIAGRRGNALAAFPTDQKVLCLVRKKGFQVTRLLNRVESHLSKSPYHCHCSQYNGNDRDQDPALHPIRKAIRKGGEGRLKTLSRTVTTPL
jgi:hypothetical protein